MKKYHITQFICNFLILCLGAILMIKPSLGMEDVNYLFFVIMLFYGMISYIHYMIIRRKDDYEYLFISLASIISGCGGIVLHSENPALVLSLSLIAWISMVAVIKLIKMDYYHDRNNILWLVRTITFVLFLIIGTLTCVNLYYNIEIQSLMLGFFLICVSVLEIFDPIIDYIICKKIRKLGQNFKPEVINENGLKEIEEETKKKTVSAKQKTVAPKSKTVTKKLSNNVVKTTKTKKVNSKTTTNKTPTAKTTNKKNTTKKGNAQVSKSTTKKSEKK